MRLKYNKEIEFFLKRFFFTKKFLHKKRLDRSIKNLDESEIELVKNFIKPQTDSIDVGVYRGVYSYEMSKYSEFVHSFEPNPVIFNDLKKNLTKICKNIKLYNYALSNQNAVMDLKVPVRNSQFIKKNYEEYYEMGKATIHKENNFQNFEKFEINTKKLDEINFENQISFIKIDVEGHEKEVIEGGLRLIKEFRPKLLVEIEKKYTKKNVFNTINYINSLGYNSFIYINNSLKKIEEIKELDIYNNYIFLPN